MSVSSKDHAFPNGSGRDASTMQDSTGVPLEDGEEVVRNIRQSEEARGATVHTFDPDASTAEKARIAGAAKAQLAALPSLNKGKKAAEAGVALGIDTSHGGDAPPPTVSLQDADRASRAEGQEPGADAMPGGIPAGAAPAIPTWVKVGWRQMAGLEGALLDDEKQLDAGILATYVSEQMYGAWYHNAMIIVLAVLATRFFTAIGGGFAWVLIILAFCAAYYSLSITRTRQRARDDVQRELVKTRLVTETESAEWLNHFLDRFWLIYEPVLSQTIVATVDSLLEGFAFGPIDSAKLSEFTLGTKAPKIDYVRTFPNTPDDVVTMDMALSFTPNDLMDMTPRQAQKRVNPRIVLSVRLGKGVISKALPVLLEDMEFTGKMRIKAQLMTNFPHIKIIWLSFIEKPTFDYVLKPLGGDYGLDINNIPGLAAFIRDQVHNVLGPMMYDPNSFETNLEVLLSGTPLDSAIGVLKVTVNDARGLKAVKFGGGEPDPYVSISLGAKPVICKTKTINSTRNPSWNETQFILVTSLSDVLNLSVWDYNEHRQDNQLGTASQELALLRDDATREGLVSKVISGGKDKGELRYDLSFFPVLKPVKGADGTEEPLPDTSTGIVRLTLHQAKDLDISREYGPLNAYAEVFLGGSKTPVHKTNVLKRQNQPIWESHCEFLVPEKNASVISIRITDKKDFAVDPVLGSLTVKLTDLLELKERGQDWLPLKGGKSGKIRMTAQWKPVAMAGSMSGAAAYVPPIGILRLWLKGATDVKNVEGTLGGKSDPYVRVMGKNKILARTEVQNNNLNPEWDSILYVPVHNLRENLILEVMDFQNIGKDRSLGYVELRVADCAEANQAPNAVEWPFSSRGHQIRNERIKLDKANTYKGSLSFEVDFKPAMSLRGGVSFEPEKTDLDLAADEARQGETKGLVNGTGLRTPVSPGTITPRTSLERGGSLKTQPSKTSLSPPGADGLVAGVTQGLESRAGGEATAAEDPSQGRSLGKDELLRFPSGVLVFQLVSGHVAHRGSVEIMLDEGYWPSFTSTRARSHQQSWDEIGEGFIRELDFSRIWIRINAKDDSEREELVAECKIDTKTFLETCFDKPATFSLSLPDGSNPCTLVFSARFVPIDIKLEPRENVNNMGLLRVEVIRANGLLAVDRGGKSDPNVTFMLDGKKIFKSDTKKKTLDPEWRENFEVMIASRVAAKLEFEINDWDRVGTADHLGSGRIDLAGIEPMERREVQLPVIHEKKGQHGTLTVGLLFQPEFIAKARNKTSTFSTAGRAITTVGGLPIAAGKGVIHGGGAVALGVGHGIGTVGGFAGRKMSNVFKGKDKSGKTIISQQPDINLYPAEEDEGFDVSPEAALAGQSSIPLENGQSRPTAGVPEPTGPPAEPGTLTVTVLGGKDLKSEEGAKVKSYCALKVGTKGFKTDHVKGLEPEWNETFNFSTTLSTTSIALILHEHHTLGRDPVLGEAEIDIWRHITPSSPSAEVSVELASGSGLIKLRLDWAPGHIEKTGGGLLKRSKSVTSVHADGHAASPGKLGGLRMSLARKDRDSSEA